MVVAVPKMVIALGWAGLLPFLLAPLVQWLQVGYSALVGPALAAYALAILCFLVGAWWGIALLSRRSDVLLLSNVIVVTACLGVMLLEQRSVLLLLALLLLVTVGVERRHSMFAPQPRYYAMIRLRLSVFAALSLVLVAVP